MSRSDDQRLADMLDCAAELAHVVSHGHQAFIDDPILRRAAERLLEIIGEAAGTLSKTTRSAYPDVAWRDISRLRIVLAHHYHRVDPDQVWVIATVELPALAARLTGGRD